MFRQMMVAVLMALGLPMAALACGAESDCAVAGGVYRISLPEGGGAPVGAIVFAHGYQGTAAGTMKNTALRQMAAGRGLALIALAAGGDDWDVPNVPQESAHPRDEMAYLDAVVADAVARFGIARQNVVITGFSAGGMFVWNVICAKGSSYAGYIPYSGTFWKGPPATCPGAAQNIVHVHGARDTTVPLAGRAIGQTRQGDVDAVLTMYRADKGYGGAEAFAQADMDCRESRTDAGKRLDFCLFDGAHSFEVKRFAAAYDLLMK